MANISDQSQGTGGSPYNVLLDLAKLGANFPLVGAGLVGQDSLGEYILNDCRSNGLTLLSFLFPRYLDFLHGCNDEIDGGRRTFS